MVTSFRVRRIRVLGIYGHVFSRIPERVLEMLRVFVSSLIALKGGREYLVITYAPFAFCAFLFFRLCVCSGASTSGGGVGCGGVDPPLAWCNYDTLHLYVLDHLSCPAMATQYERVL